VNLLLQKSVGALTRLASDGPWRSKSVLAALAAVVLGLGFWFSDITNHPASAESGAVAAGTPGAAPSASGNAPAGAHWNWSEPFPFYVRLGLSYVAGFCIGWFFRKLTRLIMVVVALTVGLLAYGKIAGCDTSRAQEQVKRGGEWAQHETAVARDYLLYLLPSGTAGGAGIFLGFRRRSQAAAPKPAA
jgi:uncharacterized membrane protein (Fun14 family)